VRASRRAGTIIVTAEAARLSRKRVKVRVRAM